MKRLLLLLVVLLAIGVLSSCQNDTVVIPTLTVIYNENHTIQVPHGTATWSGKRTGIAIDNLHPLQSEEFIPRLTVLPSGLSHVQSKAAWLQFDSAPDTMEIRCWPSMYFGDMDKTEEYKTVDVTPCVSSEGKYQFQFAGQNYVYEIIATWDTADGDGGTVHYSFYTGPILYGEEIPATEE